MSNQNCAPAGPVPKRVKCLHGNVRDWCAVCNNVVRPIVQKGDGHHSGKTRRTDDIKINLSWLSAWITLAKPWLSVSKSLSNGNELIKVRLRVGAPDEVRAEKRIEFVRYETDTSTYVYFPSLEARTIVVTACEA